MKPAWANSLRDSILKKPITKKKKKENHHKKGLVEWLKVYVSGHKCKILFEKCLCKPDASG
jgi:hypothetical protein